MEAGRGEAGHFEEFGVGDVGEEVLVVLEVVFYVVFCIVGEVLFFVGEVVLVEVFVVVRVGEVGVWQLMQEWVVRN